MKIYYSVGLFHRLEDSWKKILPLRIDTIELYKSLLNGRFIPETLRYLPFKIYALDTTFIEYRDSLAGKLFKYS